MRILMGEHLPWDYPLQVGSHHYAREFLRRGHRVLWVTAPGNVPKNPFRLVTDPEVRSGIRAALGGLRHHGELLELRPFTLAPWRDWPLVRHPSFLRWSLLLSWPPLRSAIRRAGFGHVDLLWLTYPHLAELRHLVAWDRFVHRRTDDYGAFAGQPPAMRDVERDLIREADLVVTAAESLAERARGDNPRTVCLPNGVDVEALGGLAPPLPPEYEGLPGRRFVYTGGIYDEWFAADLVAQVARRMPGDSFVLVGPSDEAARSRLAGVPNLHLLGPRPYEAMPSFWYGADAGLVPFRDSPVGRAVNPLKLYEYCACGLPVVATGLAEFRLLGSPAFFGDTAAGFAEALEQACRPGPRGKGGDGLLAFARANSWRVRVDRLFELIDGIPARPRGA